jgi:hypothetical protein
MSAPACEPPSEDEQEARWTLVEYGQTGLAALGRPGLASRPQWQDRDSRYGRDDSPELGRPR